MRSLLTKLDTVEWIKVLQLHYGYTGLYNNLQFTPFYYCTYNIIVIVNLLDVGFILILQYLSYDEISRTTYIKS